MRGHSARRLAAAAVLADQARGRRKRDSLVRPAQHRGHLLQPNQSGLLTDTFSREHVARFAEDDWRRRSPEFNEPNLSRNLALRDALRPIAQRHRTTVSAVAVAWVLAWPGVTGAIVGGRSPQQVDGWIRAASLELSTADLQEISDAIVRSDAGEGPTLPQLARADASH
jgi:aryl-alcohol dehydrogenase-like predicted oxidoreductase